MDLKAKERNRKAFYPDVEMFIGEGGSFLIPEVVREEKKGVPAGTEIEGKEAVGGIRFASRVLRPHETAVYVVTAGISEKISCRRRLHGFTELKNRLQENLNM